MRYYRRSAEREGWTFEENLPSEEASIAIEQLYPRQTVGQKDRAELRRSERKLREVPGRFFAGIRTANGEFISVAGGWIRGADMFILIQLNNSNYAKASVSTVLRGYLIETAIGYGVRNVRFIGGCEGSLKKYCRADRASHLLAQRNDYLGGLVVRGVRRFFPSSITAGLFSKCAEGEPARW